jgi:hypothetical protein
MKQHVLLASLLAFGCFSSAARAQTVDAGDAGDDASDSGEIADASDDLDAADAADAADGALPYDAGRDAAVTVLPSPDSGALGAGCSGLSVNAPCTLAGSAGFCFSDDIDGSVADLECVTDSDTGDDGCAVASGASSASALGGLTVIAGLVLVGAARASRRRRRDGSAARRK